MKNNQHGIAHLALIVLIVIVVGVVGFTAYKVGSSSKDKDHMSDSERAQQQRDAAKTPAGSGAVFEKGSSGCTPDAPVAEAKDPFKALPFNLDQVKVVTIGKETNDPRFVYPWVATDKTDKTEIFAPAAGKLYLIRHKVYEIDNKSGNDYDMFFAVDCKTVFRFNHISNPRDDIKATYPAGDLPSGDYANGGLDIPERVKPKTAIEVKAGESLGFTHGTPTARNFDFAVGLATSKEGDKIATCPFNVFSEPNKTKLLDLLGPKTTGMPQPGYACDIEAKKF